MDFDPLQESSCIIIYMLIHPETCNAPKNFLIIWFSKLSPLNVPDEDDSRNESCALNLISMC